MLIMTVHGRLGRDAELRDANGTSVIDLAIAANYGRKGDDGNRPTQWVKAQLWGKQAEALEQYLTKGKGIVVVLSDAHIETFTNRNGEKQASLVGHVDGIEFTGAGPREEGGAARPAAPVPAPRPAPRPAPAPSSGFDDMDDDIPF